MQRQVISAAASVAIAISTASLSAAEIYWQGGTGPLGSANWTDGTNSNLPIGPSGSNTGDIADLGAGGTATNAAGEDVSVFRLRVGHNLSGGGTLGPAGPATLNITGGSVTTTNTGSGGNTFGNSGIIIGRAETGEVNLSGGTLTSGARAIIGFSPGTAAASGTLNVSGTGSFVVATSDLWLGQGVNTSGLITLDDEGTISTLGSGGAILLGTGDGAATYTQNGGTTNAGDDIQVGQGASVGSTFNMHGGVVNTETGGGTAGNFVVGGESSQNAVLNFTNGTINSGHRFLMGNVTGTGVQSVNSVVNHSGGTLNTAENVAVADQGGDSTYNLSGSGIINATTGGVIGRQGTGTFNQTGGTANFNGTLSIGNDQGDVTALAANGLYEISAGTLSATAVGNAVTLGTAGTGQLRIVGDDGAVDVNGDFLADNTAKGNSTLAFELESGDGLTVIDVSGIATFNAGTNLVFDTTGAAPTQTVYDLLTATSITDNGITFTSPAGWNYQIVDGGNGQILQVAIPEPSTVGLAAIGGLLALRRRNRV